MRQVKRVLSFHLVDGRSVRIDVEEGADVRRRDGHVTVLKGMIQQVATLQPA